MAVNISQYVFKKVLRVSAFGITTKELIGSLTLFNNLTFTNDQQQTDVLASGVKIAQLDYGKSATLEGTSPLVNDSIIGLQSGSVVELRQNVTDIAVSDTFTVTAGVGTAKFGGSGAVGTEIKYAYLLDSKGAPVKTFTQDTVASPGKFSYSATTKELTFEASEVPDGSMVLIYTYPTISESKLITNDSNSFSKSAHIICDIQVADVCDDSQEYLMQIVFENGKFSGSFSWSIDGQTPAEQQFSISSMLPCGKTKLWDAHIFNEDDILIA